MKVTERQARIDENIRCVQPGTRVSYHHQGFVKVGHVLAVEPDSFKIDCEGTREIHTVPLYSRFITPTLTEGGAL